MHARKHVHVLIFVLQINFCFISKKRRAIVIFRPIFQNMVERFPKRMFVFFYFLRQVLPMLVVKQNGLDRDSNHQHSDSEI